jgi:hypothetical protein
MWTFFGNIFFLDLDGLNRYFFFSFALQFGKRFCFGGMHRRIAERHGPFRRRKLVPDFFGERLCHFRKRRMNLFWLKKRDFQNFKNFETYDGRFINQIKI